MVPCLGFPERQKLSDFRWSHGLSPWKGTVVPGRSDDISTSPQALWNLCSTGPSRSCQHHTHRATWVSSEVTVFALSEDPLSRCLFPYCASHANLFLVAFILGRSLFLLKNWSAPCSPFTMRTRRPGIISFCIGGQEAPSQI